MGVKIESKELKLITLFSMTMLFLIVIINVLSIYHLDMMHKVTKNIYEHPLMVSNASLRVHMNVIKIHRDMKDVVLFTSKQNLREIIKKVNLLEDKVYKDLKLIRLNILGKEGLSLEKETHTLFSQWKSIRDEVILLVENEEFKKAIFITKNKGAAHVVKLEKKAIFLNKYAHNKAVGFKDSSNSMFVKYENINIALTMISLLVVGFFALYIRFQIKKYIKKITEKEENLVKLSQRLEYAVHATGDGLWDWNLVSNQVYFSPRWKAMLGYTDEEIPNEFDWWEKNVHPDDLKQTVKDILYSQQEPGKNYNGVHRLRHKDGHWVWILDRGQTIFDEENKAIRMIGFHTDITKLKTQEVKIKELSRLLKSTINSIDNLIFVKDMEFKYIECNEAFTKYVGKTREEMLGNTDYDLFEKGVADFFRQKDEEMFASNEQKENYEWVTYPDGRKVYLLTLKAPLHDEDGEVFGLVGNSINLTKEELLKDKIKSQEEIMIAQSRHAAMGEMISMIAHQWRQPISVISMEASNILVDIELELLNDASLKEISTNIIKQTQELSQTIDDFRNFFKPDKVASLHFIYKIIEDALGVIGKSLQNNNISITLHVSQEIEIYTYSRELMQVFINIIKNAKEALELIEKENKFILIDVEEKENDVVVKIADNAGGIDKEILDKIFDPYFTTKGIKNGTGLGLYMSKTIIEKHLRGSLKAVNENDGVSFIMNLPKSIENEKY